MELPDRNTLKKIIVQVEENVEKGETRKVTDNSQLNISIVRRPGEGSHPLFDRDDIVNGRRLFSDGEHDGKYSCRSHSVHSHCRNESRINHGSYRRDYRASARERAEYERSRDDLYYRSRRGMCHSVSDCQECCREGRRYRTLSSERLTQEHSYEGIESTELGTLYIYQEPNYYAVWESTPSLAMYDY